MNFKITVTNPGNHFSNPLLKLSDSTYATREEACEAIYNALYNIIDGESGCEMIGKDYGTLCVCDRNGINAEPLNQNDNPISRDNVLRDYGCNMESSLREATVDDDCDARVEYVSVNTDGGIDGYYLFRELDADDYVDACHTYIMRKGVATEDGVTAVVERVS